MKVIALIGRKGAGKTTYAKGFQDAMTRGSSSAPPTLSFASPLKAILEYVDPTLEGELTLSEVLDELGEAGVKRRHPEYRRLLQELGEGIKRLRPLFFVNIMKERLLEAKERGESLVIIDDLRFPAEQEMLTALASEGIDTQFLLVHRPDLPSDADTHVSETSTKRLLKHSFILNFEQGNTPKSFDSTFKEAMEFWD